MINYISDNEYEINIYTISELKNADY